MAFASNMALVLLQLVATAAASEAAAFPTANISSRFAATAQKYCIGIFPGCSLAGANTTVNFAIDTERQSHIEGPLAQLPSSANQQHLLRFDLGEQYLLWVDVTAGSSPSERKVINCTRAVLHPESSKVLREGFLGYTYKTAPNGRAPCSFTSATLGTCDSWLFTSHFGCAKPPPAKPATGSEPLQWQIRAAPTTTSGGGSLIIASLSNTINTPAACITPGTPPQSYASVDYTQDWRPSVVDDFAVPEECASAEPVNSGEFAELLHPSLRASAQSAAARRAMWRGGGGDAQAPPPAQGKQPNSWAAMPKSNVPDDETGIAALLANMTVAEKARQLVIQDVGTFLTNGAFSPGKATAYLGTLGAGKIDSFGRNVDPHLANQIQAAVVDASRHGIAAILAEECQHGVQGDWHTMFPSPYTVAAAFDRDLMGQIGQVIGTEARAGGTSECWGPVCGLAREPRWGRSEEEMGEDPFLAGELAAAMVGGMSGRARTPAVPLSDPTATAPLLKHYAVYSVPESGRNTAPAHMGRREVRSTFLPVFAKAVKAGAQGAMSSYNEVDGVPTTGDRWLLTDQLRGEFGFTGYVTSDFGAISGLGPNNHATASNDSECVRQYIEAGGSMNGHDFGDDYEKHVVELVTSGRMPEAALDVAVGNMLRVKTRLGLADAAAAAPPQKEGRPAWFTDESLVRTNLGDNPAHRAVATRAAQESVVLLSNTDGTTRGDATLPLSQDKVKRLLVVGPNADEVRAGDYSAAGWAGGAPNGGGNIDNVNMITILEGLKIALPEAHVTFALGCGLVDTSVGGELPFWSVIQRHSFTVGTGGFVPTAPSSPYQPDGVVPKTVPASAQGLKASYFPGTTPQGSPVLTRLDSAPNFHYFALGPDPTRMRNGTFSVVWEGLLTPDSTVKGALFNLGLGKSRFNGKAPSGMGGRLYLNGKLVVDAWKNGSSTQSGPVDLAWGKKIEVRIEYFQSSTDGNPSVALQWSLLPSSACSPGSSSSPPTSSSGDSMEGSTDPSTDPISAVAADVAAGNYDAVVVAVGGANNDGSATTEGEGQDRAELSLPGRQLELLQAVFNATRNTDTKMVTVLVDGKPTAEPFLLSLPAVLAAFQGGQAQGTAVASIITGVVNPSGKLPVSFPVSADVLPVYYNHKPSAARGGWVDRPSAVLWSFGHGLSYSSFNYSDIQVPQTPVAADGVARISCTVTNTGLVYGEEVAQLYIRDVVSSVTTPVKMLKGFERVPLASGQSRVVTFNVDVATELRVLGRDFEWVVEPGVFHVMVGGSSDGAQLEAAFEVA